MYAAASGKAILAYLSEDELEINYSSFKFISITKKTITDPEILRKQLGEIRTTVLACNWEELTDQIIAIAAPILDPSWTIQAIRQSGWPNVCCSKTLTEGGKK